jgi:flagellar operon protein
MSVSIHNARISELIQSQQPVSQAPKNAGTSGFEGILKDQLKLSGHAQTRMQSRQIELDKGQWDRVMQGVDKAAAKGAKESLVMVDDVAMVVSVKNRTVITMVDKAHMKENVFTNIDSAVVV